MDEQGVAIGVDHGGFPLKAPLVAWLSDAGYRVLDLGTDGTGSVDYPDYAAAVARSIGDGTARFGIAVCGSGIGMSIALNRYPWVRAALCDGVTTARLCREHNDANVLALGARLISEQTALACLEAFLETGFTGGRHQRRIDKLAGLSDIHATGIGVRP